MAAMHEVPDWLVERLAAGDLPPARAAEVRQRLREDGQEQRLEQILRSNHEVLTSYPAPSVADEVRRRLAKGKPLRSSQRLRPFWALPMATACAAGLAMVWAVRGHHAPLAPQMNGPAEEITVKGEVTPQLLIYRKTAGGSEHLRGDAEVRRGDMLQIRYVAANQRFGIIASIDSRSHITFHLPEAEGPAAPLLRDGERALPHAYELDDAPGFERFVFVTSEAQFDANEIRPLVKNRSPLPPRFRSYEVVLKKELP